MHRLQLEGRIEALERTLSSERVQRLLRLADAVAAAGPAELDLLARSLVAAERAVGRRRGRPAPEVRRRRRPVAGYA